MPKSRIQPVALWSTHSRTGSQSAIVVVDRLPPGRRVLVGEVRPERLERLRARGADVVVDDVEDDGEAGVVRGVD